MLKNRRNPGQRWTSFAYFRENAKPVNMNESSASSTPPRRMRWWLPAAILALSALSIGTVRFSEAFEGKLRSQSSIALVLLTALLLAGWYVFLTGLRWRTRWTLLGMGAALLLALVVGLRLTVRVDGSISGNGLPRLVWKWTPKIDAALPQITHELTNQKAELSKATPEDFPQFLGAERKGVVTAARLARDWTAQPPRELWRQPIGPGWSSFAIVGKWAVTQEQRQDNEMTVCYELASGHVLWEHANKVRFGEALGGDGPRATPTINAGRVYAFGATGILDCLDGATGKVLWTRDTLNEIKAQNPMYGKSSSPLLCDNLVVVTGGAEGPLLLAYDKDTGRPIWLSDNAGKCGYSSPVLATVAGKRQILSVNGASVTGHDPVDGRALWEFQWPGFYPKCSQPFAFGDDRIFISAGYAVGCALLQIKSTPGSNAFSASVLWKNRNLKTQFSNAVERGGFMYGLDDETLVCLELATGQRRWKEGHYSYGQVLLADDLLLVQAESGELALVEANPNAYRELARLPALSSKTWNNPALAGEYLLLRNDREAVCYKLPLTAVRQ